MLLIIYVTLTGGNSQQSVAVAAVTAGQGMPVASHASMPAQPPRSTAMATAAPVKKPTPPPPTTSNPPTPSVSVPTPPPSVTPTNTNSIVASPVVPQPPQPPTSVSSFPNANTPIATDGATLTQQSDLLQPYNTLGTCFFVLHTVCKVYLLLYCHLVQCLDEYYKYCSKLERIYSVTKVCFCTAPVPTTQTSLEQTMSLKKKPHIPMIQTPHTTTNNTNLNLLPDVKAPVNMMPTSMASSLSLGNITMANLNMNLQQGLATHMSMHNQLENMINTTSPLTSIQNSHNATMSQQHSNGFSNIKRENSPPNMLNNNGIPGLNMGMNMGGMGSIFDPISMVAMPMQISQMPIKKEEKSVSISQPQMPQKPMDGMFHIDLDFKA